MKGLALHTIKIYKSSALQGYNDFLGRHLGTLEHTSADRPATFADVTAKATCPCIRQGPRHSSINVWSRTKNEPNDAEDDALACFFSASALALASALASFFAVSFSSLAWASTDRDCILDCNASTSQAVPPHQVGRAAQRGPSNR